MSFIVRRTSQAKWVGAGRDVDAAKGELTRSDADTDGLSVFEVTSDAERELVVAAIACGRQNTSPVDLIEVEREEIERYGKVTNTPGDGHTPLAGANALHRSLDWTQAELDKLAAALFAKNAAPRRYKTQEVKGILARLDATAIADRDVHAFVVDVQNKAKAPSST